MLLEWAPIAVDTFYHKEEGLLFFLTHAHEDHLKGLHARWSRGKVYCSEVTANLLAILFPSLAACTVTLSVDMVHVIPFPGQEDLAIEVTLVDANHCPGAVMFLFRGEFGSVLHTGDFRLHGNMGTRIPALLSLPDEQIATLGTHGDLAEVFLDNTFCHPMFEFPSRDELLAEILNYAAEAWPCLLLVAAGNLGKEPLLQSLAQRLHTHVRVPPKRAAFLRVILGDMFDTEFEAEPQTPLDASADDIRALSDKGCVWVVCMKNVERIRSRAAAIGSKCRVIFPTGWAKLLEAEDDDDRNVRRFPYSDHSSFPELVQFLSWLPIAPVTLLTQLSTCGTKLGYDGEEGVRCLAQLAGTRSVSYQPAGAADATRRKRPLRIAQPSQDKDSQTRCMIKPSLCATQKNIPGRLRLCVAQKSSSVFACSVSVPERSSCSAAHRASQETISSYSTENQKCPVSSVDVAVAVSAVGHDFPLASATQDSKRRRLPWKKAHVSDMHPWPPKTGAVSVNAAQKAPAGALRTGPESEAGLEPLQPPLSWPVVAADAMVQGKRRRLLRKTSLEELTPMKKNSSAPSKVSIDKTSSKADTEKRITAPSTMSTTALLPKGAEFLQKVCCEISGITVQAPRQSRFSSTAIEEDLVEWLAQFKT